MMLRGRTKCCVCVVRKVGYFALVVPDIVTGPRSLQLFGQRGGWGNALHHCIITCPPLLAHTL